MATGSAVIPTIATTGSTPPTNVVKHVVVAIKVKFELNTPDRLRRIVFGLEKDSRGETVIWKIDFQLFERGNRTDDFGDAIVALDIEVDTALHPQAEMAARHGFTPPQAAHALGPAAEDVKAAKAGELDQDDADAEVQGTLAVV